MPADLPASVMYATGRADILSGSSCDSSHTTSAGQRRAGARARRTRGKFVVQRRAGTPAKSFIRLLVLLLSLSMIAAACGGDDSKSGSGGSSGTSGGGASNTTAADDSKPVPGGEITYG